MEREIDRFLWQKYRGISGISLINGQAVQPQMAMGTVGLQAALYQCSMTSSGGCLPTVRNPRESKLIPFMMWSFLSDLSPRRC